MAATKGARLKTGDGETDFAHKEGEKAAAHESLTRLLHKYVYNQHDQTIENLTRSRHKNAEKKVHNFCQQKSLDENVRSLSIPGLRQDKKGCMQALSKISRRAGVVLFSLSTLVLSVCAWPGTTTSTMQMPSASSGKALNITPAVLDRMRGSLWGLYIGDALAMPTHWYYDQGHLRRTFGEIKGFVKPQDKLPGSIMSLSNTGGGGRGGSAGDIVGGVILKGKKEFWERGGNWFYHRGMAAGENTLEGTITRLITQVITEKGSYDHDEVLSRYITLMTTKDAHNDTYAGTAHRMFFANQVKGIKPRDCADNDGHNTDSLDGLVNLPPVIFASMVEDPAAMETNSRLCVGLFRKSTELHKFSPLVGRMLTSLVQGESIESVIEKAGSAVGVNVPQMVERSGGQDPMTACYVTSSFPALLHYAYKYRASPEKCMLANANAGGENVAKGALLGAIMGAAHGMEGLPKHLVTGLTAHKEVHEEIEAFLAAIAAKGGVRSDL